MSDPYGLWDEELSPEQARRLKIRELTVAYVEQRRSRHLQEGEQWETSQPDQQPD